MIKNFSYSAVALLICLKQAGITSDPGLPFQIKASVQGQAIKVKTELVEVRAVVTDRQGKIVENLTREDFELLENNRPRAIDHFSVVRIEGEGSRQAAAGAVSSGAGAGLKSVQARLVEAPARTVVMFVDTLHLSISSLMLAKQALRGFVEERLTEQDMVAIVTSSGSLGIAEQFTRDRQILRYAIEKISPGPTSRASFFTPYLAACVEHGDAEAMNLAIALLRLEDGITGDRRSMEAMARGRASQILSEASYLRKSTLFTLKALAEQMASLPGQRLIAVFSDGFTLQDSGGNPQTSELQSAISRAARSGVAIYSIDAHGLEAPPMFNAAMRGGAAGPRLESYVSASEHDVQEGLNAMAADTGGEMFRNANDLGGALGKALDANRCYYVLGYYLGNEGENRQFHRIAVRVKNHPEYAVRTPRGFFSTDSARTKPGGAEPTPRQQLVQAIQAPLRVTTLGVSASADYIETDEDDAQVALTIHLDGENLQYHEQNQRYQFELHVMSFIYDASGKTVHSFSDTVQGDLSPERLMLARRNGYRIFRRLPLKPGGYHARIGVREAGTDRMGTATAWVEVPNLSRKRLALSSLILLDPPGGAGDISTPESNAREAGGSRVVQGVRLYPHNRSCAYFFRVYNAPKSPADAALVFQTELFQRGKAVVSGELRPLSATERDNKGFSAGGQISFAGLDSGIYELRITVKDPQSKQTVQRTAIFGIE